MKCPIALGDELYPNALACDTYTYSAFHQLISSLTASLEHVPNKIVAFIPKLTPLHVAFFFAVWRSGKTAYPLSHRLPQDGVIERLKKTGGHWVEPELLSLSDHSTCCEIDPKLIATYIETSSSEKIVCHRYESHVVAAESAAHLLGVDNSSRYALNLPLFHIAGIALVLRTFLKGAKVCFKTDDATHLSLVPTQLWRLIQNPPHLPNLKCLLVGGAATAPTLYEQALEGGLPLYLSYGMTETSSLIALKPPGELTQILHHIKVKIGDDHEILVKGPSLLHNYWGQPLHEGWFATKDRGALDEELIIWGRKDRQFISGGENIQPEEIERALLTLPGILQAQVEPKDDVEFGQVPMASVYAIKPLSLQQIQSALETLLPRYKIPKSIQVRQEPLNEAKMAQMDSNLLGNRNRTL